MEHVHDPAEAEGHQGTHAVDEDESDPRKQERQDHADLARKYGMKVHSWTHRADSLWKPFKTSDEELDVAFKVLKLDGLFSDCPDVVIDYLKRNGIR